MVLDRIIEVAILVGVWIGVYLEWRNLVQREQRRIKTHVTRLLKRLGVTK